MTDLMTGSPTATRPLLSPEQIASQAGQQIPFLRLPPRETVYAERALRLRQLAAGHAMRDYLLFAAELVAAQDRWLRSSAAAAVAIPDAAALDAAAAALTPPLMAAGPQARRDRDPAWRATVRALAADAAPRVAAGPARALLQRAADASALDDDLLERQADRLLNGIGLGLDLALAPVIGAALQAHWTARVLQTAAVHGLNAFGRTEPANRCPCCGQPATASVTRIGADEGGYRYLHCSLCSTQWHVVRIKCTHCDSTKGIHYETLAGEDGQPAGGHGTVTAKPNAVQAECCDECGHYLKRVAMERDPDVEPVADDLATLALDLLVSEAGHQRAGTNLLLVFGDGGDGDAADDGDGADDGDDPGGAALPEAPGGRAPPDPHAGSGPGSG